MGGWVGRVWGGQSREGASAGKALGQGEGGHSRADEEKEIARVWGCIRAGGGSREGVGRVGGGDESRGGAGAGRAGRVRGRGWSGRGLVPAAPAWPGAERGAWRRAHGAGAVNKGPPAVQRGRRRLDPGPGPAPAHPLSPARRLGGAGKCGAPCSGRCSGSCCCCRRGTACTLHSPRPRE